MSEQHDPAGPAALPPGARLLSTQQAVDALVSGDHPQSRQGNLAIDAALIALLRQGRIIACRLIDGRIAFHRHPDTTA
ncbi:hypothetical protein Aau02nite_63270 [Amorphoplanes auranticolor]|uniref:Uncharacterized protein n=2 Tax=Actinoplanes auranticolor TaxID=47988 RepID=A0A919SMK4_9ACTN|nr:hypothetical protein Aau02nite_63270 [Actinoplanes auranticolor]